jgi:hypothetical protein
MLLLVLRLVIYVRFGVLIFLKRLLFYDLIEVLRFEATVKLPAVNSFLTSSREHFRRVLCNNETVNGLGVESESLAALRTISNSHLVVPNLQCSITTDCEEVLEITTVACAADKL